MENILLKPLRNGSCGGAEIARAAPAHTNTPGHGTWSWAPLAQETKRGINLDPNPAAVTYQCCFHCRAQSDHCGPGQCRENDHSVPIVSRSCGDVSRCVTWPCVVFTLSLPGGSGWLELGKGSAGWMNEVFLFRGVLDHITCCYWCHGLSSCQPHKIWL